MMNKLETDALTKLLDGPNRVLELLREQAKHAKTRREFTGTGFYIFFELDPSATPIPGHPDFVLGDVFGDLDGLQYGAEFLLFIRNGVLGSLEGGSYEEKWPEPIGNYRLFYKGDKEERDISALEVKLPQLDA